MPENKYKSLFENKFITTHKKRRNIFEEIYYKFSSSTYNERVLFSRLKKETNGKTNLKIVDLGCGGGHQELTDLGQVYGVDISASSLENAKKMYFEVKEIDITGRLPYEEAYFDVAFCSEVFGHIERDDKDKFLAEIVRIIKPGGIVIFSVETFGNNILTRYLKSKNMFQKYWIDYQGHIGLETPSDTVTRISKYIKVNRVVPTSKSLLPVDGYLIFSDQFLVFKIFENNLVRRAVNMLEYPFFLLSVKLGKFDESNDLVVVGCV